MDTLSQTHPEKQIGRDPCLLFATGEPLRGRLPQGLVLCKQWTPKLFFLCAALEQRVAEIISRKSKAQVGVGTHSDKNGGWKKKTVVGEYHLDSKAGGALGKKENAKIVQTIKLRGSSVSLLFRRFRFEEQRKSILGNLYEAGTLSEDASTCR